VLHAGVPAAFKEIRKGDEVRFHIGSRVLERVANPGLGREVDDTGWAVFLEQPVDRAPVGDVAFGKAKLLMLPQHPETRPCPGR